MPQLWVVAGPNGSGKTTIADRWLAPRIPVVSPDSIAVEKQVSPIQAGKFAIIEQEQLLSSNDSFAIDTTLSGNRELSLMRRASEQGFKVNLVFVCVEPQSLCIARIQERIEGGGHAVPPEDVDRRYQRSLINLPIACALSDRIFVLDNSGEKRRLMLSVEDGRVKHLSTNLTVWAREWLPSSYIKSRDYFKGR